MGNMYIEGHTFVSDFDDALETDFPTTVAYRICMTYADRPDGLDWSITKLARKDDLLGLPTDEFHYYRPKERTTG